MIETWLLDVFSNWKIEIMPSAEWIEKKFRKHRKREDVWHCFAGLKPLWRDAILQFLKARNDGNSVEWSLYLIEMPQSNSKMGLRGFRGHKYDDQLVQVVLFKRKDSFSASNNDQGGTKFADSGQLHDEPNTPRPINSYFNQSLTNAQVHPQENQSERLSRPKVSFAQEVDERANNQNTISATNEPLSFNTEEGVRNAIKRLGEKKKKLGAIDQEHVDEINDMILLLAAQLKLQPTLSPNQRRILYGENGYDQMSATDMKSHPKTELHNPKMNTAPIIISNAASNWTDQTEEIFIPRDGHNKLIGKDATMSQVTRPEVERYRDRRRYFAQEDPYVAHDSRQRPHVYENTPIIINNESRTQMPAYAGQDYGPSVAGKELVIRQNSPSRLGSFGRRRSRESLRRHRHHHQTRERELPRYEVDKRRRTWEHDGSYHSSDSEGTFDQTYARNRPRRAVQMGNLPDRNEEIVDRRYERENYFPRPEEQILIPIEERIKRKRDKRESLKRERDEIIIRRDESERERPIGEREGIHFRARIDSLSSADEAMQIPIPDPLRHTLRTDYRSPSPGYIRPAVRRTSTFDDGTWPGVESKALILRTGGSRPTPGYMQEWIEGRSIRVRGEQDVLSPPEYYYERSFRSPPDSRHSSYSERDRASLPRRPSLEPYWADYERSATFATGKPFNTRKESSHGRPRNRDLERVKNRHPRSRRTVSSSEDDDYLAMPDRVASKQQSKPSDEEVITQTLKRFTTFQGDQPPNATQSPAAASSSRRPNTNDLDTRISNGRGLETMFEEPDAMTNGPGSPSQSPFYPSTNRFPPPPGPRRSPDSTSGSPKKPRVESQGRGYDIDVAVPPTYRPRDYYDFPNANAGDSPISPVPEPARSNKAEIDARRQRSNEVSPALVGSTRAAPNAVANGQVKGTKEARITELSDGSSEDGRRKLHGKDRKATVEDFEPDLEAGDMAAGTDPYD